MTTYDTIWSQVSVLLAKNENENPVINFVCRECRGAKVFNEDNIPVCSSCGLVDTFYIDETAEWTSGITDDGVVSDPARCCQPNADPEMFSQNWGKGTIISTQGNKSYKNRRMSKINFHQSMSHKDRSLYKEYEDMEKKTGQMGHGLPKVILQQAKILYKKFDDCKQITRGYNRLGIKGNCILYACRIAKCPRTTKEIADMFGIQPGYISKTTALFREKVPDETQENYIIKPEDVIMRLGQAFELNREERMGCFNMCSKLENCPELMSKTPTSIATTVLYLNLSHRVSKSEVCKLCEVSVPTLNKIEIITKRYLEV